VFFREIRKKEEQPSPIWIKTDRNIFLFPEHRKSFFRNLISKVQRGDIHAKEMKWENEVHLKAKKHRENCRCCDQLEKQPIYRQEPGDKERERERERDDSH